MSLLQDITLAMRIPLTHWCSVLTSSQHRYLMYCDFFWIWGCCVRKSETLNCLCLCGKHIAIVSYCHISYIHIIFYTVSGWLILCHILNAILHADILLWYQPFWINLSLNISKNNKNCIWSFVRQTLLV